MNRSIDDLLTPRIATGSCAGKKSASSAQALLRQTLPKTPLDEATPTIVVHAPTCAYVAPAQTLQMTNAGESLGCPLVPHEAEQQCHGVDRARTRSNDGARYPWNRTGLVSSHVHHPSSRRQSGASFPTKSRQSARRRTRAGQNSILAMRSCKSPSTNGTTPS